MEQASPLQWPQSRVRTPAGRVKSSRFETTEQVARAHMIAEIRRMGGKQIVVSTNKPTRSDGMPYASAREPDDSGVAVYFERKGERVCFSCDQYQKIWENMRAIGKTIEAMRGIERWGSTEMLDQAFVGFAALPAPEVVTHWCDALGVPIHATLDEIQAAYKAKARKHAGSEYMTVINVGRDQAIEALKNNGPRC